MTVDQILIIGILLATAILFLWGRWRHDLVAIGALLACIISGLISYSDAFSGFSHPAVITVACILILSAGLQNTGAVDWLTKALMPVKSGPTLSIISLTCLAAILPGFMKNVGTLAILIPVAGMMQSSGAADLIVTMTLPDLMNNAATAAVMYPIALGTASQLNVNPDAFLVAVAVGASCAFLTPIGHQNNTLILGPGGFQFGDYWRLGLPLEILVVAISIPILILVWPLY